MTRIDDGESHYVHDHSEGSMLIYAGCIASKLAGGELFAYAEVLQVMKVLWRKSAWIGPPRLST